MNMLGKKCAAVFTLIFITVLAGCGGGGHKSDNLQLSVVSGSVTAGSTAQLHATRDDGNGNLDDVTTSVKWSSSQTTVATISQAGVLSSLISGTTTISATVDTANGVLTVAVGGPAVKALTVSPQTTSVPIGYSQQFTASATYVGTVQPQGSASVVWSVSPASVATITTDGLLTAKTVGSYTVTATSGSVMATSQGAATNAVLTSVAVSPGGATVTEGSTQQFIATGTFSDQSMLNVNAETTWSSSNTDLLTIASTGIATAMTKVTPGTVTIFAQVGALTGSTQVNVALVPAASPALTALIVTPTASSVAKDTGQQLVATGYYADGSQQDISTSVSWESNNPGTSSVDATGLVRTTQPGAATIQASVAVPASSARRDAHGNAITSLQAQSVSLVTSATLTSLVVNAPTLSLPIGASEQLSATGIFSDGTKQDLTALVTWQSPTPAAATVSAQGSVVGVAGGTATIIASFNGQTGTSPVLFISNATLSSVQLTTPSAITISGLPLPLTVTGNYSDGTTHDLTSLATFQSSDPTHISVNNVGLTLGIDVGYATMTASALGESATVLMYDVYAPLQSIAIIPATTDFAMGTTIQFKAVGTFAGGGVNDITTVCVWSSSSPVVLTVDSVGRAKSGSLGTAIVTASLLGVTGISGAVTVTPASLTNLVIAPGNWQMADNSTEQYTAIGNFSDGTTQELTHDAYWTSADPTIAPITVGGAALGLAPGTTHINASLLGQSTSTNSLVISNASLVSAAISPVNPTIALHTTEQIKLIGTFSDGTTEDLTNCATWVSSDPNIAQFNLPGLVQTPSIGSTTVTATCNQTSAFTTVSAVDKTLDSIAISPSQAQIAIGDIESFQLVGTFSDGSMQTFGQEVSWSSSNPAIATLAGGIQEQYPNDAIGVTSGNTTISASYRGFTAPNAILHVTPKPLSSVVVTPASPTIVAGGTQQFSAQAVFTDGTSGDITGEVQWTSSNPSLVGISAGGLATAQSSPSGGSATITATTGTFVASTVVQVPGDSSDVLTALTVLPTSSRIAAGTGQQLVALGKYTDGTTRDISSVVTWTSSDPSTATVDATGLAAGIAPGTATLLAQSGTLQNSSTLIVTPATLVSVAVSPSGATFANGTTQPFQLIGTFSDGSTQVLTGVSWQTSNPSVATISGSGVATGTGVGTVMISGTYDGQTATSSPSQVTAATLTSISVQPSSASFAMGTSQQFQVIGSYSDGTTENLTSSATFQSSDPTVVNVSAAGLAQGVGTGTAQITVSAGGMTVTSGSVQIVAPTLSSIAITPANPRIAAGTTQAFTAIGTFSDGSTQDLTSQAVWTSSAPAVATINQYGVAEAGTSAGTVQFTATDGGVSATTGSVQVTQVTLVSIAITPTSGNVAKGTTQQFTATGTFSDGSTQNLTNQVSWSSSNGAALTINSAGLATGVGTGSASITAVYGGQTATTGTIQATNATLVSVAVTPATASLSAGNTQQYALTGTFSDGTMQDVSGSASWTSSSTSVAGINSTGLATAASVGSTTITGQSGTQSATATLTVTAATLTSVAITPDSGSIASGTTQQFTATGTYSDGSTQNLTNNTTWFTANTSVLTIDSHGLATARQTGATTVTAESSTGSVYGSFTFGVTPAVLASIAVTPATASVMVSATQQFTATGTYTDSTHQDLTTLATWSSSAPGVATVTANGGLATGVSSGSTTIQAQYNSMSGSGTLTVASAPVTAQGLVITPSSSSIAKGTHQQFTAMEQFSDGSSTDVTTQTTWQSSVSTVATINSSGLATGVSGGSTQITGTYGGFSNSVQMNVSAATLTSLAVTPTSASIANGTTQQFTATGTLSDGSTEDLSNSVTWTSNNTNVATINSTGLATGHTNGTTTISAQSGTTSSNNASLTVTTATLSSLSVQPSSVSAPAGNTQQLLVTANFTDGTSQNVTQSSTYSSSAPNIATVSSGGLVTTVAQGTATVTVTLNANTATVPVAVSAATLQSIAITPTPLSLAAGSSQQLTATGTYSDGSTANVTNAVTWASSASNVLTVSTTGLLTSSTAGNATVTATLNGIAGTLPVTVTSAVVRTIAITPSSATLAAGQTQQYTAIATLSDNSQQTVTTSAHWSTSDPTRATISNTSGSNGLLTSVAAGTVTVSASLGSGSSTVTGTATAIINSATLSSIAVAPTAFTIATGTTQQLTVTGTYSDNSSQDLTTTAVYSTNAATTASVSSTGLVTATAAVTGVATITATVGTLTATATATVTPNTLLAIAVTPAASTIANGLNQQMTATGTYAGNQQNITSQVQWTSSNPVIATINAAGLATSVRPGTTTITATSGGTSGNTTLTIGSATLQSLTVQSVANSFANGTTLPLQAIGNYSDGSTQDLTSSVSWTSLNTAVGVVSQAGVASGVSPGVFGAQASLNGLSATKSLTVTNAVLQSITLTPANMILVSLAPVQYTASGHFSDGSVQVLTTGVHWSTTSNLLGIQVGTISQSGQLSATAVGSGTVVASYGNITGSTNFTVISL